MNKNLEPEIIKTLDRLKYFAYKNNPLEAIAPFYHAVNKYFIKGINFIKIWRKLKRHIKETVLFLIILR